jgi:hypothetical protein
MSTEKKYTERELVLAQRRAFRDGAQALYCHKVIPSGHSPYADALDEVRESTDKRYPLPKVTRPRVVSDGTLEWKYENGYVMYRYSGSSDWYSTKYSEVPINPRRVEVLADLLANPTETVDAE